MNNNANKFDFQRYEYKMVFSPYTYFYRSVGNENALRATFDGKDILAFKIIEKLSNIDLFISFPENFVCTHFFKNNPSLVLTSSSGTHLTYHGASKYKKHSSEIHLKQNGQRILSSRQGLLEAPLASSSYLSKFPLPICRFELTEPINDIKTKNKIRNYFELNNNNGFFLNTIDIYLAKKGFIRKCLVKNKTQNEILLSLFVNTSLRTFSVGKLGWQGEIMSRAAHFGQLLVLPCINNEIVIFNVLEQQNRKYMTNSLHYFHTKNYFETLTNRNIVVNKEGKVFLDLKTGRPKKWQMLKDHIK